jgi:hypothetical protein
MLIKGEFSSKFGVFTYDGPIAPNIGHVEGICSTTLVCPLGIFVKHTPFCYCIVAVVVCMDDTPSHCIGYCGITISVGHEFGIPTHLGNICGVAMGSIPP